MAISYHSLADILKICPHIRLAEMSDNQDILDFYHQTEMKSNLQSIKYLRGENFFSFLQERSSENLVFTLWNDDQKLEGVAVVSYRSGYINKRLTTVGYLGDLRIKMNRQLIREWRKMLQLFITHSKDLPETKYCRYYQSVLIDDNLIAKANLVTTKISNLLFKPLQSYKMINIIGRIKLPLLMNYSTEIPKNNQLDELVNFMEISDKKRFFGRHWKEELPYRLDHWHNFGLKNLRVIRNSKYEIIAVANFWNPIATKQVTASQVPFIYKAITFFLNFFPFIEFKELPSENKPINILYLNQLIFSANTSSKEKTKILNYLINETFAEDFNMLAYCDFKSQSLLKNNFRFFRQSIDMTLYTVHYIDENGVIRDDLALNPLDTDPGFEMASV